MEKLIDELQMAVISNFQKGTKGKPKKPKAYRRFESRRMVFVLFFSWGKKVKFIKKPWVILTEVILIICFKLSFQKLEFAPPNGMSKKAESSEEFRLMYIGVKNGNSRHLEINYKVKK
ncbi:MAG: hypothetical protein Q8K92_08200 [Leadbetterella sp.]|nr:hypothetical protein [Leadbetterella sp.]